MSTSATHLDTLRAALEFDVADRLTKSMHVAGVTVPEMADAIGVSPRTVGNYTSGRTKPSKLVIKEWAVRTGVPLEWLETGQFPDDGPNPQTLDYKAAVLAPVITLHARPSAGAVA